MSLQIAVIIPGPTERKRIDKTAEKLATHPQLHDKLVGKLPFLDDDHQFNAYFKQKLQEYKIMATAQQNQNQTNSTNGGGGAAASSSSTSFAQQPQNATSQKNNINSGQNSKINHQNEEDAAAAASMMIIPSFVEYTKDPLPDDFSIPLLASGISQLEMDLIQLGAQHAALYGDLFLETARAQQQQQQQQSSTSSSSFSSVGVDSSSSSSSASLLSGRRYFDFLNPQHPRFAIFEKLRQAYVKILGAVAAVANPEATAALLECPSTSTDVAKALTQTGKNNLITRLELLAGETSDDVQGDPDRAREAFLYECNVKRSYMLQEDLRRKNAQMSDAELRNRLTWDRFVVQKTFTFESLKLTKKSS